MAKVLFLAISYLLSKVGAITPATRSKAIEIINAAQNAGHPVRFVWGKGGGEHADGNALDMMVYDEAAGDFIRNYIWAHRARLRLRHVIWEQHITSTVVQPGVRRKMADRGSVTENHYDHNHVKFLDSAAYVPLPDKVSVKIPVKRPPVKRPVAVKVRTLVRGMSGDDVKRLQAGLKRVFPAYASRLVVDGKFGPATERAIKEFQDRSDLKQDGSVGRNTRAELRKSGVAL